MAEHKVEHKEQLTRGEAARMLSEIARQLAAARELVLALGDQEASCTVADRLEIEVEVKAARDGGGKIEIELNGPGSSRRQPSPRRDGPPPRLEHARKNRGRWIRVCG